MITVLAVSLRIILLVHVLALRDLARAAALPAPALGGDELSRLTRGGLRCLGELCGGSVGGGRSIFALVFDRWFALARDYLWPIVVFLALSGRTERGLCTDGGLVGAVRSLAP